MKSLFLFIFGCTVLMEAEHIQAQSYNHVTLHLQVYNEGVCIPMIQSPSYAYYRYKPTKHVFQSGIYYNTVFTYINSPDSGDLNPQSNHMLQSSSIQLKSNLHYQLVLLRYRNMSRINPDSMVINISKMASDAQVMISFQKGKFNLKGMKNFKTIKGVPNFQKEDQHPPKTNLKLDSTAYFTNGKTKAIYYKVAPNYPLHYVQEFDSVNPNSYAHGYQVIQPTAHSWMPKQTPIWKSAYQNKSGYWEYIKNGKRTKLEMWASLLKEKYEWYPSGQLKKVTRYSAAHLVLKHTYYNPKGLILEEYTAKTKRQNASLKIYSYSSTGQLIMASTYHSSNGIIPQGLQKRTIYYPTGQLKMEENFVGSYSIKYYSKDGKEVQK